MGRRLLAKRRRVDRGKDRTGGKLRGQPVSDGRAGGGYEWYLAGGLRRAVLLGTGALQLCDERRQSSGGFSGSGNGERARVVDCRALRAIRRHELDRLLVPRKRTRKRELRAG